MLNHSEFSHPRLVSVFDTVNPVDSYQDFYVDTIYELGAKNIINFGCGTGLLTRTFIAPGRIIIGIDPYSGLIEAARKKDIGDNITWINTHDFDTIESESIDIIVLSGHVAQFLIDDESWQRFLCGANRVLKTGGHLLFESRNTDIEPFASWPTREDPKVFEDSPQGKFSWWWEGGTWKGDVLSYSLFYHFQYPDETIESPMSLIFRNPTQIISDAEIHRFDIKKIFGDGKRGVYTQNSEEMIFLFEKI